MDPYQRAKTVRIGKWRWPPPKGEEDPNDSFLQFKIRQQSKKMSKQHDGRVSVMLLTPFFSIQKSECQADVKQTYYKVL